MHRALNAVLPRLRPLQYSTVFMQALIVQAPSILKLAYHIFSSSELHFWSLINPRALRLTGLSSVHWSGLTFQIFSSKAPFCTETKA